MVSIKDALNEGYCPGRKLSKRETEVLVLTSLGFTDSDMANILGCSARTIQTHMTRILLKLSAANRTHAACLYIATLPKEKLQDIGLLGKEEAQ